MDKIWFLTQREWSAGSAMWSLSLERESCSESVSTASASEEDRVCHCSTYIVTFIVLYGHAVVKKTLFVFMRRECLRSVILMSEDPQVACPYRDEAYACDCILQEREIRAVRSHSFILLLFCLQIEILPRSRLFSQSTVLTLSMVLERS